MLLSYGIGIFINFSIDALVGVVALVILIRNLKVKQENKKERII